MKSVVKAKDRARQNFPTKQSFLLREIIQILEEKNLKNRLSCLALMLLFMGLASDHTFAAINLAENGDLTGPIPETNGGKIPSVPPGWTAGIGNVDMHESGGTGFWGESYPESVGGTQFIGAVGGEVWGFGGESFLQVIDGLEPG